MQLNIKLKGFFRIAAFLVIVVPSVSYTLYKAFSYCYHKAATYYYGQKRAVFSYTFKTHDPLQKGFLLLSPAIPNNLQYGMIAIMGLDGRILMQKKLSGAVSDFRQWNINGHIRYSYMIYDPTADQTLAETGAARHAVILDSALNEIKQIHLQPHADVVIDKKQDLDHHDFILISDGHYITMASYVKTVNNIPVCLSPAPKNKVAAWIIQEIQNGVVIWQWDATKYPEFYLNSDVENKFYDTTTVQDYIHMNSMTLDPRDSNLVVSFRNLNQLIKINRKTGDIIWRLGGRNSDFPLTAAQVFLRQHHPTFIDSNTLLLFDNGENDIRPVSRILEFKLNEEKKTITAFRAYTIPEPFSGSKGSVQKIGDDYLICGGSSNYILEVNSISGAKKMELLSNQAFYRAYFVKDITGIPLNKK
jgi:arylsulfate sulfotransferase